jgi:hypothetical protein
MSAYGDLVRRVPVDARIAELERLARALDDTLANAANTANVAHVASVAPRRELLEMLLIESGELAQGLIDFEFEESACDRWSALHHHALALVRTVAEAFVEEVLDGRVSALGDLLADVLTAMQRLSLPHMLVSKVGEGFAFYGVDPELYARAARPLAAAARPSIAIGIRSIGTTLGAVVAAAANAEHFVTVRPAGDPFHRTLALDFTLRELLSARDADYLIVDEGPGLSGSSFGCVADALEANGVAAKSLHFFPSHANPPGSEADPRHLQRWLDADRRYVSFEEQFAEEGGILNAVAARIGTIADVRDLGGGAWRSFTARDDVPSWTMHEMRKYLVRAGARTWLMKFAGIGRCGIDKEAKSLRLSALRITPPFAAIIRGFALYEWLDARPLDLQRDRAALLDTLGRYFVVLASDLDAPPDMPRLAPSALFARIRESASWTLPDDVQPLLERWSDDLVRLDREAWPSQIDGRMHAWEWIAANDGRVYKCDAVDHMAAHDGIGAQDLAWDLAGAELELTLSSTERSQLIAWIGHSSGRRWPEESLAFYRFVYAATQLAAWQQAMRELAWNETEVSRLQLQVDRYSAALRELARTGGERYVAR